MQTNARKFRGRVKALSYLPLPGVCGAGVPHTAVSGCLFRGQPPGAASRDTGARCSQLS